MDRSKNSRIKNSKADTVGVISERTPDFEKKIDANINMTVTKIRGKKYVFNFEETAGKVKNVYSKVVVLEKKIEDYSINFFKNLFEKAKESFVIGVVALMTTLTLVSCGTADTVGKIFDNPALSPYVLNQNFRTLQNEYQGAVSYLTNFNNFNTSVYKQKGTAYVTVPAKFREFITKDGQIELKDIIDYINKNKDDVQKINELYKVDWTIFQKGALYETVNSPVNDVDGSLGASLKETFSKEYGQNYPTYSRDKILDKKIMIVSNFIKSPIFNGTAENSAKLLSIMEGVVGKINDEKVVEVRDLIKINQALMNYGIQNGDENIEMRGMYGSYILNNLIFLLTQSPQVFVDDLLSNGLKFEVGYGDNGYLNIMGHIIYSKNAKIVYDDKFIKYVDKLNKAWKNNEIEIIMEPNSIVVTEQGSVVVPGEIKSMVKFFNDRPNSELKKVLINSTTLSDYMVTNFAKIEKKGDKTFFINGVKTLVKSFQKDFNLTDEQITNLFEHGDINGNVDEISVYGVPLNLVKNKFNNKFIPDYYEKILMNNPNFTTLIHESSHKFHLNGINANTNNGSFDLVSTLNNYPYTSNYENDLVFKEIFKNIFYRAYKGELKPAELDYFGYYALSTFNYFEFIAELNSSYLAYPKYNEFITETDPENSKTFLELRKFVHEQVKP